MTTIHVECLPSLLPTSAAARDELLEDEERLRALCEECYLRFVGAQRSAIGVRIAGRVVSNIHRELSLPVPEEQVLYRAMMQHTCAQNFALDHPEFVAFIEKVLCQCLRGTPLGAEQPPSPWGPLADEDADMVVPQFTSAGMITIHTHKLDGTSASITVNDADGIATLQEGVQEQLGVPRALQRLLFNSCTLDLNRPLYEQGVLDGAAVTVLHCRPQAMLLRTRREKRRYRPATETVPAVETDVGSFMSREIQPEAKHSSKTIEMDPLLCKNDRCGLVNARARKVSIGRFCLFFLVPMLLFAVAVQKVDPMIAHVCI